MRTRPVLLTAAVAAVGLAALGTVMAQQPPSGALPVTTVRPYTEWTPTPAPAGYSPKQPGTGVQPAGAFLPTPPGYTPQPPGGQPGGAKPPRLTSPVMAGADGVRPAGGFALPPPSMDVPTFRPGTGATTPPAGAMPPPPAGGMAAPAVRPAVPPSFPIDTPETKFQPAAAAPGGFAPPLVPPTPVPAVPVLPAPTAVPVPPPVVTAPSPFPAAPATPVMPPAALVPPATSPAAPTITPGPTIIQVPASAPATVMSPAVVNPAVATPAATTTSGVLPSRTAPSVVVEAVSPESVVFGQEFQYKLIVRNTGTSPVMYVRLEDEIPSGARYVGSDPTAELNGDRLVWLIGALDAGAEKHITVRVKPSEEGDARSRATITFAAAVDARTRVTRPRLAASVTGGETARAGEETVFQIKVTNSGSGPATKLVLQARLSDGLLHSQGVVIEAELPSLPPGETRSVPLKVAAAKAGLQWCQIVVGADGSPDATAKASVNVVEPMLVVKQTGPAHCLVRAEPSYTIELANPGTATTDPVQLQTVLPDGFEYLQASDGGSCNGKAVTWKLPSLAPGSTRAVTLKLRAVTASEGSMLRTLAQAGPSAVTPAAGVAGPGGAMNVRPAGRGLEAKAETLVAAEGVAAVRFEVIGLDNPVQVGKEATYEIRVMNQGTGPCANVQLAALLAEGTEYVSATNGPANQAAAAKTQGQQLLFDAIPSLGVKAEMVYRVRVRGAAAGDLRFRVQLTCDQLKTPVVKEESTTFYKE